MTDKMIIRPSSVDTFLQCPQQWKRVFIDGESSIPGARAALGTAVHRAAETMWTESIAANEKITNIGAMTDAAMEAFREEEQKGLVYDEGDNKKSIESLIKEGTNVYVDDIAAYVPIPEAVEKRYTVEIHNHPMVEAVSGTVDYDGALDLADLKTTKRKATPANYEIQQSIYRYLREANGNPAMGSQIHNITFKKESEGIIMPAVIDIDLAKASVNALLDTLSTYAEGTVNPDILFRGNPKYYLCDAKYCAFYNSCKFRKGY